MLTIGQLARHIGVTTKTIRVYHAKGLLPEPDRDAAGYRRYTAHHAVALIRIRTLAEAGVPIARIRDLQAASHEQLQRALDQIDSDLSVRIHGLQQTQRRLRLLTTGNPHLLPDAVSHHLDTLPGLGFSPRWVALQSDLWLLVFATHPDVALDLFRDPAQALANPELRQIYLDYDHAHDLDPSDPRIRELADRMVRATRSRYGTTELPGQDPHSDIPELIQTAVNTSSAAWRRLDQLVRAELHS